MNIILNGFHRKPTDDVITKLFERHPIESAIIIHTHRNADTIDQIEANFKGKALVRIDYRDTRIANYSVDWNTLEPLDEALLADMRECESVALKMMERLGKSKICRFRWLSHETRKALYLKHLRYWNHMIKQHQIDLFVSNNIPHLVADYIVDCLCKKRGIRTLYLHQTAIPDASLIVEDWKTEGITIANEMAHHAHLTPDELELKPNFANYLQAHLSDQDTTPFYMKKEYRTIRCIGKKRKLPRVSTKKSLNYFFTRKDRKNGLLSIPFQELPIVLKEKVQRKLDSKRLARRYQKLAVTPELGQEPFIYVALHFQPEMTTCPLAGVFVDQLLLIEMLSYYLPEGVKLYVKEHPKQTILGRSQDVYDRILSINNTRLISKETNTYDLINSALAVATCTGTAGWEALLRGKPVLLFGAIFYQYMQGVFRIRNNADCQKAIAAIMAGETGPDTDAIKRYLHAMQFCCIEGYGDTAYQATSSVDVSDIPEKLYQGIMNYLQGQTESLHQSNGDTTPHSDTDN